MFISITSSSIICFSDVHQYPTIYTYPLNGIVYPYPYQSFVPVYFPGSTDQLLIEEPDDDEIDLQEKEEEFQNIDPCAGRGLFYCASAANFLQHSTSAVSAFKYSDQNIKSNS